MPDLRFDRLISLSQLNRPLETRGGGAAANMSAEIGNYDGALTAQMALELAKNAEIKYLDSAGSVQSLFSGTIKRIVIGPAVQIEIEA